MKSKFILLISSLILGVSISACSSQPPIPDSKEVNISISEVYGDDSEVVSIIPDTYTLKYKEGEIRLKLKLKLEKIENRPLLYTPQIILKDEDGVEIVNGWHQMIMSDSEKSKFNKFVQSSIGTEMEFVLVNDFRTDYFYDVMTKTEKFSLDNITFQTPSTENNIEQTSDIMKNISDISDALNEELEDEELDKTIEQTKELLEMEAEVLKMLGTMSNMLDE